MDLKELKEILQILEEKEITEFELEQDGVKLRVVKTAASANHASAIPGLAPLIATVLPSTGSAAGSPPPSGVPSPEPAAPVAAPEGDSGLAVVKSPIVGTFYRAADPNSPPFVEVGDRVRVGQVLCIIEAMKLMNEIEADCAGTIVEILAENGKPVEFGQKLYKVKKV